MQMPLQITIHNMDQSEAVEARIRAKAEKLNEFFQHIMSCRVIVELQDKHRHQGKQFTVRIDIKVPGNEIVADREHKVDV